jgi:competence transcription factor ComK
MVNKAEYIRRYKKIHREKTGVDLSNQEAIDLFEKLTTLVSVIYRSIPKE